MAEGWPRHLRADTMEVWSAGIETHGLKPLAVRAMKLAGVDISSHHSKLLDDLQDVQFDLVVTVCDHADEHCPHFSEGTKVVHHGFDDPPRLAEQYDSDAEKLAQYQRVCGEIKHFITKL